MLLSAGILQAVCKKMKFMDSLFLFLAISLLCLPLTWAKNGEDEGGAAAEMGKTLESWQSCNVFMAPSSTGWGVFAARDYREGELVDAASLVIRTRDDREGDGIIKSSVLDDYVYGYVDDPTGGYSLVVLYGYTNFCNHHPEPNVQYYKVGSGYSRHTMGFRTLRAIQAGEQMFTTYGKEDGGIQWFQRRGMAMMAPKQSIIPSEALPQWTKDFCSNIYGGFGRPFWETNLADQVMDYGINASYLAPFDAGFGDARAKRFIAQGERIEIGPGLIVSSKLIDGTALASLVFAWHDLSLEQQASIRILREKGELKLQHQSPTTNWQRVDVFETFEDLAILPASGQMGLVRRVGGDSPNTPSNCRMDILPDQGQRDGVTVILELVATKPIDAGEILLLNSPWSGTKEEVDLLRVEIDDLGQPHYEGVFDSLVSGNGGRRSLEDDTCSLTT